MATARMIPIIVDVDAQDWPAGEKKLYKAFSKLSDKYIVLHSTAWVDVDADKASLREGEADFIVINKDSGIIVFEVKDGDIYFENGECFQVNRKNKKQKIIDPMKQAQKSKHRIIDILNYPGVYQDGFQNDCQAAVWFTYATKEDLKSSVLPPNYDKRLVLSYDDLSHVEDSLDKLFSDTLGVGEGYYNDEVIEYIIDNISPTSQVVRSLTSKFREGEEILLKLTKEQEQVFSGLRKNRIALIEGGAGTGKTILAMEKAKQMSLSGKVLLLAFNNFLVDDMQFSLREYDNIDVRSLNRLAKEKKIRLNYHNDVERNKQLSSVLNLLSQSGEYTHFIVDEAQDFAPEHLEQIINLSNETQGVCYFFFDLNQYVNNSSSVKWLSDALYPKFLLTKNCRCSAEISNTAYSSIEKHSERSNDELHNGKPIFYVINNRSGRNQKIRDIVHNYESEGISPDEIVILSCRGEGGQTQIPNDICCTEREKGKVLYTTARKFKGLEASIIILTDVDYRTFEDIEKRNVFYVAASRAKYELNIVAALTKDQAMRLGTIFDPKCGENYNDVIEESLGVSVSEEYHF